MKTIFSILVFSIGFFLVTNGQKTMDSKKSNENAALATKIVTQVGNIKEGEIVLITGGSNDIDLMEDIALNVGKVGGYPLITIGSERMTKRWMTEVPAKYDERTPDVDLKLFEMVNTIISLDYGETPGLLADIPAERFAARGKAMKPVSDLMEKRKIKGINLGNGLFPSEAKAKQYGMTKEELSNVYWKGVNADYKKIESVGKAVKSKIAAGKVLEITNPNGTNLKMRIENRQVFVSDGVLSEEDLKSGYAGSQVFLPAGEVYLTPVPGTAEGKVVVDRQYYQDKEITGLTLNFEKGKLTSWSAKSGLDPLKARYELGEAGKEDLAFVDIGINPDVTVKPGSKMVAWMPAGMVTIGTGSNVWAGGENTNPLSLSFFLPGSTVKIDGTVIVENGALKVNQNNMSSTP